MNYIKLFLQTNTSGPSLDITSDMPTLPAQFDQSSESMLVDRSAIPVFLYQGQNFSGQYIKILGGGGCNDLSTLSGNWFHKIRSIKFSHHFTENKETEYTADLTKK